MSTPPFQYTQRARTFEKLSGQMRTAVIETRDRELEDYLAGQQPGAWTGVTFDDPRWSAYGSFYQDPQYRRHGERVEMRGMMSVAGPFPSGFPIFTLPVGDRPNGTELFNVVCSAGVGTGSGTIRLDVMHTGVIRLNGAVAAGSGWVSISGISVSVTA